MTIRAARAACVMLALLVGPGAGCKKMPSVPPGPETCLQNGACAPNEYCVFTPGLCGRGPVPGVCRPRPASCAPAHAPVCGCDGQVHNDECAAQHAGVDLAVMGGCKTVLPDWAPCGPRFCDVRTRYCEM